MKLEMLQHVLLSRRTESGLCGELSEAHAITKLDHIVQTSTVPSWNELIAWLNFADSAT